MKKFSSVLICFSLLSGCAFFSSSQTLPLEAYFQAGTEKIDLEVADTPGEQSKGLMFRGSLEPNRGMLFVFNPPQKASFWMKNTRIPLDMIFIKNGQIKKIVSAQPCFTETCPSYGQVVSDKVIELNYGRASELGLRVGQFLKIEADQHRGSVRGWTQAPHLQIWG